MRVNQKSENKKPGIAEMLAKTPPIGVRPAFRSTSLYKASLYIWIAALASLPIDLLLSKRGNIENQESYLPMILLFTFASIAGLPKAAISRGLAKIRRSLYRPKGFRGKQLAPILVLSLLLIGTARILLQTSQTQGLVGSAIVIIIGLAMAGGVWKVFSSFLKESKQFRGNLFLLIERWNTQVFAVTVLPIICCRALSLYGALLADSEDPLFSQLPYLLASALLLLNLKPELQSFVGPCLKCSIPNSIVMQTIGSCPRCTPALFGVTQEALER